MREGKTERQITEIKREEREIFYIILLLIYIILICSMKK